MKKICATCGKEFECYDKKIQGRRIKSKKRSNSINCSHECSQTYARGNF